MFDFNITLPVAKPKGFLESMLFYAGYVSKEYVSERERYLVKAFNQHIRDTVIRDRKGVVLKLRKDREKIGEGLIQRIKMLEDEIAAIRKSYKY
ncbi:MAG: hypothetical protein KKD39_01605 [Candidatus Altiarchaeota archaeon]|nr:hypothetical protein [Candidatus Altiarchaeota archaeon]